MKKFRSTFWAILTLCMVSILTSCSSESPEISKPVEVYNVSRERAPIELTSATRAIAEELTDFYTLYTTDVAKYVDSPQADFYNGNFVCSPLGAALVFGMTANGIEEAGQKAFQDYLGVFDIEALNELSLSLLENLPQSDELASLDMRNAFIVNTNFGLTANPAFAGKMEKNYGCTIHHVDFSTPDFQQRINDWYYNTFSGFERPAHEPEPNVRALLLNVLRFKAAWRENLFDSSRTEEGIFYGVKGENLVEMMESEEGLYLISESYDFTFVTLFFGNGAFSFNILLPKEGWPIEEATKAITPELLTQLKQAQEPTFTIYRMPKFKLDTNIYFTHLLRAAGRGDLTKEHNLSMFDQSISGDVSYQQVLNFSIDESGAVATAGSFSGEDWVSESYVEYREVNIDRPFFFFVNEYSTGACLLSGRITEL